jgi:hypothetical protein
MRKTLAAALFAAFAACALAAAPSRQDVLGAITILERNATSPEAVTAAKTIVNYAQDSDDVMVDIGPDQIPWVEERWGLDKERELSYQSILLAAFVAGNVRSQIKNERAEDDTYSGWIFAIRTYDRLRAKAPFHSASIEQLSRMESEGTLRQHAKELRDKADKPDEGAATERKPLA